MQRDLVDDDPVPAVGRNGLFQLIPRVPPGAFSGDELGRAGSSPQGMG